MPNPNLFPPKVTTFDAALEIGDRVNLSSLFTVSDFDPGSVVTRYRFRDNSTYNAGGYFVLNNVRQQSGVWIEILASDLANVYYQSGLVVSAESFGVQAFDGLYWSNASYSNLSTIIPNVRPPVVTASPASVVAFEGLEVEGLFTAVDPDGYAITKYRLVDRAWNSNGGYFTVNGVAKPSATWFEISAADLVNVRYVGAQIGESENVGIRAFDGLWGSPVDFAITTTPNLYRPVVVALDFELPVNTEVPASSLFTFTDDDTNTIKLLRFYDTGILPTGGYFTVNGVVQAPLTWFDVTIDQLPTVVYHTATQFDFERFRVKAFDGKYWSVNTSAKIESVSIPKPTSPPVVSTKELVLNALDLLIAPGPGPSMKSWQVIDLNDHPRSGRFYLGNASTGTPLDALEVHTLTTAQFDILNFRGGQEDRGREFDSVIYRGFNGTFWSDWKRIEFQTDAVADFALNTGLKWNTPLPDGKTQLTFTFIQSIPGYYADDAPERQGNPAPLTELQRLRFREAMAMYEEFLDVRFVEISDTFGLGNLALGRADDDPSVLGHAYLPEGPGLPGDIWLNSVAPDIQNMTAEGILTIIHEMGHALGLKHPFDPAPILPVATDSHRYSVMSYTRPEVEGRPETLMLYDLMALQSMYGANMDHNPGNTEITLPENYDQFRAIWDAGGFDTLNLSNQPFSVIADLRPGRLSTIGVTNNVAIGYNVDIENLTVGRGDDTLIGNELDNVLIGNEGNDIIYGNGGLDLMRGGIGNDDYRWVMGDGYDTINEEQKAGRDSLSITGFGDFDNFTEDLKFRLFNTRDLNIQLTINGGTPQGEILIKDMAWGGSRVETLKLFNAEGTQIVPDIDLRSIFVGATTQLQAFTLTEFTSQFGTLAAPV